MTTPLDQNDHRLDDTWRVLGASSENIVIDQPDALEILAVVLVVEGQARTFEGVAFEGVAFEGVAFARTLTPQSTTAPQSTEARRCHGLHLRAVSSRSAALPIPHVCPNCGS